MEEDISTITRLAGLDAGFNVSESLIPVRNLKEVGHSAISFDGLLSEPLLLKEDLKDGCGGQLWPAGMVLAKYLLRQHRTDLYDKQIVELGAGGGLVGLAVARGCDVGHSSIYITDQSPMFSLMETNVQLNDLSSVVTPMVLNWGEVLPTTVPTHPTIILAADCVYFEPAFPLLISTLEDIMGPASICYFCFKKRRRADMRFMKSAKKSFDIEEVLDDPDAENYRRDNIFMYTFRLKKGQATNRSHV